MTTLPPARSRTRNRSPAEATRSLTPEIRRVLGPSPLTRLERQDDYEAFLERVADAVGPTDIVEWIWVKDIVDLTWEVNRARRAQAVLLTLARLSAAEAILYTASPRAHQLSLMSDPVPTQAHNAITEQEAAKAALDSAIERLKLGEHAVEGYAYSLRMDEIERLQRLADNASVRRTPFSAKSSGAGRM